jgi:hypothetical protein
MMKSVLIWLSYEFLRPKLSWLFDYLVRLGEQASLRAEVKKEATSKKIASKKVTSKEAVKTTCKKTRSGNPKMKEANELARQIRKDGELWYDALKRAHGQLKLLQDLEKK